MRVTTAGGGGGGCGGQSSQQPQQASHLPTIGCMVQHAAGICSVSGSEAEGEGWGSERGKGIHIPTAHCLNDCHIQGRFRGHGHCSGGCSTLCCIRAGWGGSGGNWRWLASSSSLTRTRARAAALALRTPPAAPPAASAVTISSLLADHGPHPLTLRTRTRKVTGEAGGRPCTHAKGCAVAVTVATAAAFAMLGGLDGLVGIRGMYIHDCV